MRWFFVDRPLRRKESMDDESYLKSAADKLQSSMVSGTLTVTALSLAVLGGFIAGRLLK